MKHITFFALVVLLLSSCGIPRPFASASHSQEGEESDSLQLEDEIRRSAQSSRVDEPVIETTAQDFSNYVGLSKWEAIAVARSHGRPWRISRQDGSKFPNPVGADLRRVNFVVENNVVVAASKG